MHNVRGLIAAAQLFKVLGNESRLSLMLTLGTEARTVGALVRESGLSQPLVSQHLRTLRQAGLVYAVRDGREVTYHVADAHVSHVVADAIAHVEEPHGDRDRPGCPTDREKIEMTEIHAEHSTAEHTHGNDCGHEAVQHDGHTDYVHGTHHHALHEDHYDEHEAVAEHSTAEHAHGNDCGHEAVQHDGHTDYLHGDHRHAAHAGHYDEH